MKHHPMALKPQPPKDKDYLIKCNSIRAAKWLQTKKMGGATKLPCVRPSRKAKASIVIAKILRLITDLNTLVTRCPTRDTRDICHHRTKLKGPTRQTRAHKRTNRVSLPPSLTRLTWFWCRKRQKSWVGMPSRGFKRLCPTSKRKLKSYSTGASLVFKRWCGPCRRLRQRA